MAEALTAPNFARQWATCPFKAHVKLRVVVGNTLLCECVPEEAAQCQWGISIGRRYFCRALWKSDSAR